VTIVETLVAPTVLFSEKTITGFCTSINYASPTLNAISPYELFLEVLNDMQVYVSPKWGLQQSKTIDGSDY
jgi:hypothetical protein